jgi:septum site-determining protein MinC
MYPGHIVVMGDVNPGAELEAEGDIIVIGVLRGKAHAGSAGNTAAQVWSLSLQPIQLRIAEHIWVGGDEKPKGRTGNRAPGPHKAVVKDGQVSIVSAL